VGALKKAGLDASAVMDETRELKEELEKLDQAAAGFDEKMRMSLASIPNLTRDEVPSGHVRSGQRRGEDVGREAGTGF
jgi:seryl-tRNA synthetase